MIWTSFFSTDSLNCMLHVSNAADRMVQTQNHGIESNTTVAIASDTSMGYKVTQAWNMKRR